MGATKLGPGLDPSLALPARTVRPGTGDTLVNGTYPSSPGLNCADSGTGGVLHPPDYRRSNGPDRASSPIKIILLPVSAVPWLYPCYCLVQEPDG